MYYQNTNNTASFLLGIYSVFMCMRMLYYIYFKKSPIKYIIIQFNIFKQSHPYKILVNVVRTDRLGRAWLNKNNRQCLKYIIMVIHFFLSERGGERDLSAEIIIKRGWRMKR